METEARRVWRGPLLLAFWWLVVGAAGCSTKASSIPPPLMPRESGPPRVVGVGDTLQIGYFLDQRGAAGPYKIGPGDALKISVADHPELSQDEVLVLPDGRITLHLIGPVPAAGRTVEEVAAHAAALYRERKVRRPDVVVSVTKGQQRARTFLQSFGWGLGGVSRIEIRVLDEPSVDLPLVPLVAVGRPIDDIRRDIKDAYARQFGEELQVTVNLAARSQGTLAVLGEVKRPGSIEVVPDLDLVGAIAIAGGFAETAQPREVLVLRLRPDGVYERWLFDLGDEAFAAGGAGPFRLQRSDVVYVGKSTIAKVNKFVEQYVRNVLPVTPGIGAFYSIVP